MRTAGANGFPDPHFLGSFRGAGGGQVDKIHTGNQQDEQGDEEKDIGGFVIKFAVVQLIEADICRPGVYIFQGQQEQLIPLPCLFFRHVFFQIIRKFLLQRSHISPGSQFQVSTQPVASPVVHPFGPGDRVEGQHCIELQVRVLRYIFEHACDQQRHRIAAEIGNRFTDGIFVAEKFPGGFLGQ